MTSTWFPSEGKLSGLFIEAGFKAVPQVPGGYGFARRVAGRQLQGVFTFAWSNARAAERARGPRCILWVRQARVSGAASIPRTIGLARGSRGIAVGFEGPGDWPAVHETFRERVLPLLDSPHNDAPPELRVTAAGHPLEGNLFIAAGGGRWPAWGIA